MEPEQQNWTFVVRLQLTIRAGSVRFCAYIEDGGRGTRDSQTGPQITSYSSGRRGYLPLTSERIFIRLGNTSSSHDQHIPGHCQGAKGIQQVAFLQHCPITIEQSPDCALGLIHSSFVRCSSQHEQGLGKSPVAVLESTPCCAKTKTKHK